MNGEYNQGEEMQEITITVRFKVKHSPATDSHLQQILLNYFTPKGVAIGTEHNQLTNKNKLVIEI